MARRGTFSLRTGPEAADTATVTVVRTGTTLRLTGLPAGYGCWDLDLRAVNAGGHSNRALVSVTNSPQELAPAPLRWSAVTGATGYRVYFLFPDDAQGCSRLGLAGERPQQERRVPGYGRGHGGQYKLTTASRTATASGYRAFPFSTYFFLEATSL